MICPYCKKSIPQIQLKPSKGQMDINIKCHCLNEDKTLSIHQFMEALTIENTGGKATSKQHKKAADKYCRQCSSLSCKKCIKNHNNHVHCNPKLRIECTQHTKSYSHYCKKCNVNCCSDCIPKHYSHILIKLSPGKLEDLNRKGYNELKFHNREKASVLINEINNKINALIQMKNELQSILDANELINDNLYDMFQSIRKTALAFVEYPSYDLMLYNTVVFERNIY